MKAVKWTAYGCFGLAALSVIMAMSLETPAFLAAGVGAIVLGIGFLAADRGLVLLSDIRNALMPGGALPEAKAQVLPAALGLEPAKAARTAAEIAADIRDMKARS